MKNETKSPGRGWAYAGLLLGLAGSVTGNVANTVLTDSGVHLGLRVPLAVAWPLWTWFAIEVLTRIEWRQHWSHWITKAVLTGPTAMVAAFVSYLHLHHLMVLSGEPGLAQAVGPLAIDGTLFGCTVALLVTRAHDRREQTQKRTFAERIASVRTSALDALDAVKGPAVPRGTDIGATPTYSMWEVPLGPEAPKVAVLPLPEDAWTHDPDPMKDVEKVLNGEDPTLRVPSQRIRTSPRPSALRGSWDVAKAVRMLLDGSTDAEVIAATDAGAKSIQRARRALTALKADPTAEIPAQWKVPAQVVQVIREEVRKL